MTDKDSGLFCGCAATYPQLIKGITLHGPNCRLYKARDAEIRKAFQKAFNPGGIKDELWNFVEYIAERGQEALDDHDNEREVIDAFVEYARAILKRRRTKR